MASNTVEPTKVIYVECMNFKPHDPHTWREGFLWHRKRKCNGVAQVIKNDWLSDMMINYCAADVYSTEGLWDFMKHRHYFGFCPERSDDIIMLWECLDPFCDEVYEKFRMFYRWETLTNRRQVIYKKQKI